MKDRLLQLNHLYRIATTAATFRQMRLRVLKISILPKNFTKIG